MDPSSRIRTTNYELIWNSYGIPPAGTQLDIIMLTPQHLVNAMGCQAAGVGIVVLCSLSGGDHSCSGQCDEVRASWTIGSQRPNASESINETLLTYI